MHFFVIYYYIDFKGTKFISKVLNLFQRCELYFVPFTIGVTAFIKP